MQFEWKQNPLEVYICDASDLQYEAMIEFCEENNLKMKSYGNQDVSDVSGQWDTIALFRFENTEDALVFKLKFK